MSIAEKIKSNVEVHGLKWTVAWANKKRINPDVVFFTLTGRYMRSPAR